MSPTPNKAATQAPPYPTMIRILPSTVAELHRTRLHGWPDPDCVTASTCRRHKSNVQVSAGLDRGSLRLRARDHSIILHSIILPNHPANHPAMHSRLPGIPGDPPQGRLTRSPITAWTGSGRGSGRLGSIANGGG